MIRRSVRDGVRHGLACEREDKPLVIVTDGASAANQPDNDRQAGQDQWKVHRGHCP